MSSGISRDDWLRALQEARIADNVDDQAAVTTAEFAEMFHLPRHTAERQLRMLVAAGRATRTTKRGRVVNGRLFSLVAYRLAK